MDLARGVVSAMAPLSVWMQHTRKPGVLALWLLVTRTTPTPTDNDPGLAPGSGRADEWRPLTLFRLDEITDKQTAEG